MLAARSYYRGLAMMAAVHIRRRLRITDTFIDGFWYLDQLGQLAALNVQVIF